MDTNDIKIFLESKKFYVAIAIIFGLAILVGTYSVGVAVGYRKARFSYAWGENYHQNFGGPRNGLFGNFGRDLMGNDFIEPHGTFGQIIKIDGQTLIVRGRDNVEKIIIIDNATEIRHLQNVIKISDLKIDEPITVIGEPNDQGQIVAKFIRVLPIPPIASPLK